MANLEGGVEPEKGSDRKMFLPSILLSGLLCLGATCSLAQDADSGPGYRSWPLKVPATGKTGFTRLPGSLTGLNFTNQLSDASAAANQIRMNGSGVAAGDVDGDGWCDLYFCGLEGGNRLYRNLGGWRFEDITDQAGVRCSGQYSTGAVLADVDGDGDLDLLVNSIGGGTRLFLNDGKGHFQEATRCGLVRKFGAMSMALGDVNGDGTLDLYVANYRSTTIRSTGLELLDVGGKLQLRPEDRDQYELTPQGGLFELGEPDVLYLGDGKGRFTPVPWTNGAFSDKTGRSLEATPRDWGLSVVFRDLNGDGAPDIYVCNDFASPDRVWMNDGSGRFEELSPLALRCTSTFSMGVDFGDLNRDGHDDFLVVDMLSREHGRRLTQSQIREGHLEAKAKSLERAQLKRNVLQLSRGDGTYAEIAHLSGLEASEWSWGPVLLDVDLDGYEDILITTGHDFDTQDSDVQEKINTLGTVPKDQTSKLLLRYPRLSLPIQAFHNSGNLNFQEVGHSWGFDRVGVRHGVCCADLDHDGDLDLITNDLNDEAGVYRNEGVGARVAVRLKGAGGNTAGIGSKVWLYGGAVPVQSQEMMCGGRYLSGDEALRVFAAGSLSNVMRIEVRWRSGKKSVVEKVRANREYEIEETGAVGPWVEVKAEPRAMFEDASGLLKQAHHEEVYNDFERQEMLPHKLSQLGPGVSWSDVDGDGREDLLVSGGRGGQLDLFLNRGEGKFQHLGLGQVMGKNPDEQTTVLGWASGQSRGFLVGQANYVKGGTNGVRRFELWAGGIRAQEVLSTGEPSVGPMALGDVGGQGQLGLFVGGRVRAGRWPEAVNSQVYRQEAGRYVLDEDNSRVLDRVGLVSGAVWSDLDGDGYPELILACEWGPLRVFHNERGHLKAWDVPVHLGTPAKERLLSVGLGGSSVLGLSMLKGFWNGVAVGDFDGDGRMDIVASNWGSNTKYEYGRREGRALRVYYGDLDGDGFMELLEGYYDGGLKKVVPWKTLSSVARGMPWVRERYPSHGAYSTAGIEEILGERLKGTKVLEAQWLESTVFLNRGDHFEAVVLPGEAQYAPGYGVSVGDMDGDGREDVFMSQNFFGVDEETTRCDGGRGVWLRGNGKGGFEAVRGQVSGVKVYGEGRGSALCDYDGDGRVDLVVGQNGGETKLYHNVGARPGLRVRLEGPAGNPEGVGAVMRLRFGERWGAAREVHGGGGYWSQDSAVEVLGTPEIPTALWVRWPGGKTQQVDVPQGSRELRVTMGHE